jgi:hypothetical protein
LIVEKILSQGFGQHDPVLRQHCLDLAACHDLIS